MTKYLLSAHSGEAPGAGTPMTPEEMQRVYEEVLALEAQMRETGTWVFGGRLHGVESATVVRQVDGRILTTDGPYVESKEHLGGFYVIEADDLDAALRWAGRVTSIVGAPIEVRPFAPQP